MGAYGPLALTVTYIGVNVINVKVRPYRQSARAASTQQRRAAILDAVDAILIPDPGRALVLDEVARRAGTTPQTILRHFRSRAGLLESAARRGFARVKSERDHVPAGEIAAIAEYLARHYEEHGPMMLRMIAVEADVPGVGRIVGRGRDLHRSWVRRVFEPRLRSLPLAERRRRVAMLAAVTDLLCWKVLRLEQGLSRPEYRRSVLELLGAIR